MGKKADRIHPEPDREPRSQYAALPWRRTADGAVMVLVITSRETKRWVIPKGWPIKGLKAPEVACREAFEEAGLLGEARKKKLWVFHYAKRLRSGRLQPVKVAVYAMAVSGEAKDWPEKGQRDRLWISPAEASTQVDEPELRALIAAFTGG